jgi:hypothetical protein
MTNNTVLLLTQHCDESVTATTLGKAVASKQSGKSSHQGGRGKGKGKGKGEEGKLRGTGPNDSKFVSSGLTGHAWERTTASGPLRIPLPLGQVRQRDLRMRW